MEIIPDTDPQEVGRAIEALEVGSLPKWDAGVSITFLSEGEQPTSPIQPKIGIDGALHRGLSQVRYRTQDGELSELTLILDHHPSSEDVERYGDGVSHHFRSACRQALALIDKGIFTRGAENSPFIGDSGERSFEIVANDLDEDVFFTAFLLQHTEQITHGRNAELLRHMIQVEDLLDCGCGVPVREFSEDEKTAFRAVRQVAHPYRLLRTEGELYPMKAERMQELYDLMEERLLTILRDPSLIDIAPAQTDFEVIKEFSTPEVAVIRSQGEDYRLELLKDKSLKKVPVFLLIDNRHADIESCPPPRFSLVVNPRVTKELDLLPLADQLNERFGLSHDSFGGRPNVLGPPFYTPLDADLADILVPVSEFVQEWKRRTRSESE